SQGLAQARVPPPQAGEGDRARTRYTGDMTTIEPREPLAAAAPRPRHLAKPAPAALLVALVIAAIVVASVWYLVQPRGFVVQGEADATRIDMAARVDGRVASIGVARG